MNYDTIRIVEEKTLENSTMKNRLEECHESCIISIGRKLKEIKSDVKMLMYSVIVLFTLLFPSINFAQVTVPNLGSSFDFVLFSGLGAVSNTGLQTAINGDIGTASGAITGFADSGLGGSVEIANARTAAAAIDVANAYNEIFAIPSVAHAPAFGGGETLNAGAYSTAGAGSVGGVLTLDGENNSNAIFIFKFGGAFTTTATTTVNLINGALADNIFWIANGAMAMATNTSMKGTLIANPGAVSAGDGCSIDGRMFSVSGAISTYNMKGNTPNKSALPIELLSFSSHCKSENTVLEWQTASEINNNYFTIEQSYEGVQWNIVGTTEGAGNSSKQLNYSLTNINRDNRNSYYRLKQTDHNGDYKYVGTIFTKKCKETEDIKIYPNPTSGKFKLLSDRFPGDISSIAIHNSHGKVIHSSNGNQLQFDLSNNISGYYFISIIQNSELIHVKLILDNNN
jgi:hypothetical protein